MNKATPIRAISALFVAGILALASCKEKTTVLAVGVITDSAYSAGVEAPEARRILIEEATGVKCSNCPAGVQVVKSIEAQYPDRVIPVGIHGGSLTDPFPMSRENFRNAEADALMNSYFGEGPNKPAATIDRTQTGGKYFIDRSLWTSTATARLAQPKLANITITSDYNTTSKQAAIRIRVAFTQPVAKKLNLSLYLVEDGIVDPQEDGVTIDTFYVHNNVLRDVITPINGKPILTSMATKDAGQVYQGRLVYAPSAAWNPDKLRLVAFVHTDEANSREVIQVAEAHLK